MMRILPFLLLLSGCIAGAGYSTRDRVTTAAREYNEGVRWAKLDQAAAHIPRDKRDQFLAQHQALEDELEIADMEVVAIDIDKSDKKKDKITARVDYTWTLKRVGLVEKTTTRQTWEEKDGAWVVAKEERVKGSPLALFEEPAKK
jgi:hypothetical protein